MNMIRIMSTTPPTIPPIIGPIGIRAEDDDVVTFGGSTASVTTEPSAFVLVTRRTEMDVWSPRPVPTGKPFQEVNNQDTTSDSEN